MDENEWLKWITEYVGISKNVFQTSGFIGSLLFSNSNAATKYADIYDGTDTTGEKKMRVQIPLNSALLFSFPIAMFMPNGLYVSLETTAMSVTVQYKRNPKG